MIFIITEENDRSTCDIIDWLIYYNEEYIVVTDKDKVEIVEIDPSGEFIISIDNKHISSDEINGFWYRRGELTPNINIPDKNDNIKPIRDLFNNYAYTEYTRLNNFIHYSLFNKNHINNFLTSDDNKIIILNEIQKKGILIPETIITSSKKKLIKFKEKHKNIITKPSIRTLFFGTDELFFQAYTEYK